MNVLPAMKSFAVGQRDRRCFACCIEYTKVKDLSFVPNLRSEASARSYKDTERQAELAFSSPSLTFSIFSVGRIVTGEEMGEFDAGRNIAAVEHVWHLGGQSSSARHEGYAMRLLSPSAKKEDAVTALVVARSSPDCAGRFRPSPDFGLEPLPLFFCQNQVRHDRTSDAVVVGPERVPETRLRPEFYHAFGAQKGLR